MDLQLLIQKLKDASQYADQAWKEDRAYPFLDLSIICEEAAEWLIAFNKNIALKAALYAADRRHKIPD